MIFGVPVDPLLQMPCIRSDTTSGSSGTSASTVPRIHARSASPRWTRAAMTSRSWSSSQAGRSQRTGIGVAPSFQPAKAAIMSSGQFGNPRASRSPGPRPRAASAPASWLDRRSISAVVTTRSPPSSATWV